MRCKRCLILSATIFLCFIINYIILLDYSLGPSGKKATLPPSPLENIGFRFLYYNRQCAKNSQPFIVLLITSFSGNVEARDAIRRAYPVQELNRLNIVRVFLLAKLKKDQSRISPSDISREIKNYGDVLIGDFFESYRNLTYKHLMGLKWASEACVGAKYIAKMDDDIVVDLNKLMDIIFTEGTKRNITLLGYFFGGMAVSREKSNKWYVTKAEYDEDYFPAFLSGWLYVTTPTTASILVSASRSVPFLWIDDVYITGLLARKVNVAHQNISIYFSQYTEFIHCCIKDRLVCDYVAGPCNGYYALHNSFKQWTEDCKRGLCKTLSPGKTIKDVCRINGRMPVDRGKSIVQQIMI